MKDKATEWLMGLNPFDKVKGHTKIELTDVKTGAKQIIEKDNTFQAGVLANYMRSMGAYNNNPYANGTWAGQPIWRNLCGGILCFEDAIDLTGGEVEYMPAGNKMVANGAYMVNNAGTPIELGSYNEVESSTSGNDSVTFVYDWLTSQGNGVISCVCLTTEIGGYIGYGNPSGVGHATRKSLFTNQSSASVGSGIIYNNASWTFGYDFTEKILTVTKTPIEVTKGSIFDKIAEDSETYTFTGDMTNQQGVYASYIGNGDVIIRSTSPNQYGNCQVSNGSTYYFIKFNLDTHTFTQCHVENTSGYPLKTGYGGGNPIVFDEQYAFFATYDYYINPRSLTPVHMFNYTTGAYIQSFWTGSSGTMSTQFGGKLSDGLISLRGNIYDTVNDTLYPTNGSEMQNYTYNDDLDAMVWGGCYKNPLILATVNNLETPVTKTAAQTMKITYTLTKAVE